MVNPPRDKPTRSEKTLAWRRKNKEKWAAYQREYSRKKYPEFRDAVLEKLGGRCVKCGFSDHRALQIDHIEGLGRSERKRIGWYRYYSRILKDSTGYQLLCANCNFIKRYTNGEVKVLDPARYTDR